MEYDSATFASYINTLQRQHFVAEKLPSGYGARHQHDWFNAKSASTLVEASQSRVSQKKLVMDNESENPDQPNGSWNSRQRESGSEIPESEFGEDEAALRDSGQMEEDDDVMEMIASQSQPVGRKEAPIPEEPVDEEMREIMDLQDGNSPPPVAVPPPIFRPVHFDLAGNLTKSVERRMRKNHEPVLEELPKWSLLAKVLKEIEDTMARIKTTHAGE